MPFPHSGPEQQLDIKGIAGAINVGSEKSNTLAYSAKTFLKEIGPLIKMLDPWLAVIAAGDDIAHVVKRELGQGEPKRQASLFNKVFAYLSEIIMDPGYQLKTVVYICEGEEEMGNP